MINKPDKAFVALLTALVTGAGFVAASGTLHGTTLIYVDAGIAAIDAAASTFGVYLANNTPAATPAEPVGGAGTAAVSAPPSPVAPPHGTLSAGGPLPTTPPAGG